MQVLESEAKELLAQCGLPVPQSIFVETPEAAFDAARELNKPVVVKAQVLTGGRMKAGGVRFADSPEEAQAAARTILGQDIRGHIVNAVLIEERIQSVAQVFCAVTYDNRLRRAVVLVSREGGIEIESNPNVVRHAFSLLEPINETLGAQIVNELYTAPRPQGEGLRVRAESALSSDEGPGVRDTLASLITNLIRQFLDWDALLLETNPLILDEQGQWWIADVHLDLDDDALARQSDLLKQLPRSVRLNDQHSEFEKTAAQIDRADHRGVAGRLVSFGGNLGLLIGGGGASLTIMDAILDAGLKPANYCEIGGNPSVWKIKELTKLILAQPNVDRLAVIMNVVSNTRVDLVARGVIKGILEMGRTPRDTLLAFRIPGAWEDEGKALLDFYGVPFFDRTTSLDQVVETMRCQS